MFERPHHQRVAEVLSHMNAAFLWQTRCFFGGGTAVVLQLDEYRESADLDFLCSSQEGYRALRAQVFDRGLDGLISDRVGVLREVRADQYGIRAILNIAGNPLKFEIIREARIDLEGVAVEGLPVPCLERESLFAEKLLANADRYADRSVASRDLIDLVVMEERWGPIPPGAWERARSAYGDAVEGAYRAAMVGMIVDPDYLAQCLEKLGVRPAVGDWLRARLRDASDESGVVRP